MRWIAQVGHVAAKDLRRSWAWLLFYAALIAVVATALATYYALGPYWPSPQHEVIGMRDVYVQALPILVVTLGILVAVALIQGDSPTRANAFWSSRPLSPSAVLTGKLSIVALLLLVLPLAGLAATLRSFDSSGGAISAVVLRAALTYVEYFLSAMIVAGLTDDLRAALGAYAGLAVGAVIVFSGFDLISSEQVGTAITLASVASGLALLVYLYRTHHRSWWVWTLSLITVIGLWSSTFTQFGTMVDVPFHDRSGDPD